MPIHYDRINKIATVEFSRNPGLLTHYSSLDLNDRVSLMVDQEGYPIALRIEVTDNGEGHLTGGWVKNII